VGLLAVFAFYQIGIMNYNAKRAFWRAVDEQAATKDAPKSE
jgi:hypothetical protein